MLVLKPCISRVRVDELAFAPDGRALIAPGMGPAVMLWREFANGAKAERVPVGVRAVEKLAFTPCGSAIYAGNDELGRLDLLGRTTEKLTIDPWNTLWFGLSPDGSRLVLSERLRDQTCRVTCWRVGRHDRPLWEVTAGGFVASNPFILADERFVFVEHRWTAPRHWFSHRVTRSLQTGNELNVSSAFADTADSATMSADRHWLACRTREMVRVYPTEGGWTDFPTIKNDSKKHFTGIAFHPSGKYLAATSNDETVKLYDTATWDVAHTFTWKIGRMRSIAFSPDGALAAAGSDKGQVMVWDVEL